LYFVFFVNLIGKPAFSKCEHVLPGIHNEEIIVEIHIVDMNHILVIIVGKNIRIKITDEMKEIIRIGIMKIMDVEEIVKNIEETELIEGVDTMMIRSYGQFFK
jgi:hypothetical protein